MVSEDSFIDEVIKTRLTDEEAREEICRVIDGLEIAQIKFLPRLQREEIIARVKKVEGIIQRQMSLILGIPLSLVNRV